MNDTYVAIRLVQWAEWSIRRADSGLGYPKQVPYTNLMPRTGMSNQTPEFVDECFETDKCVMALRVTHAELYDVIDLAYRKLNITIDQKLKQLGCCRDTYYRKIGLAHRLVLGYLNDSAAGIALPSMDVKAMMYG